MSDISIVEYTPDHKEDLLAFLSFMWTDSDTVKRRTLFEWRYEKNPYTKMPLCYLALDGTQIVGHRGFVFQRYIIHDRQFSLAIPVDAVVHPKYRRRGIFSELTAFAEDSISGNEDLPFIISLASNLQSTAGNLKAGFTPVGDREYMYFLNRKSILNPPPRFHDLLVEKGDIKINICEDLKVEKVSTFMDRVRDDDKISNVRDEAFYSWRFKDSPHQHIYAYCTKEGQLVGYISLHKKNNRSYSIMEYGYREISHLGYLLREIVKYFAPITAYVFTRSRRERSLLSSIGFKPKSALVVRLLKRLGVIEKEGLPGALIKPVFKEVQDLTLGGKDVQDPDSWSFFASDLP